VPNSTANGVNAVVILVVEDELFLRVDITGCLREASERTGLSFGQLTWRSCVRVLMGSLNGWDVAERFRMQRPDAPVLYASADAIDRERCAPGSVFIAKPYRPDDILTACQGLRPR